MKEKKEVKLKEREELLNKIDQVFLSTVKGKAKKTSNEEFIEGFKRELGNLSPLEDDEVVKC